MRIAIAGAGALGSVVGGLLARAGEDVVLLAHGAHAQALAQGLLELRLPDETIRVNVETAASAEADLVLLTAKRFDSQAALARIEGRPRLALSLQNGLGKNRELRERFGDAAVVPALSTIAASLLEPGTVASPSLGITYVAAEPSTGDELTALLSGAGIPATAVEDGVAAEWSKLAHVASVMAVQALTRKPLHELFGNRDSALLLHRLVGEIGAVAAAEGARLLDLDGLVPVATLARSDEDAAAALFRERAEALKRAGATNLRTSMLTSIDTGRRSELDFIHGELCRRAEALGVAAPALETCYRLARAAGVPR